MLAMQSLGHAHMFAHDPWRLAEVVSTIQVHYEGIFITQICFNHGCNHHKMSRQKNNPKAATTANIPLQKWQRATAAR